MQIGNRINRKGWRPEFDCGWKSFFAQTALLCIVMLFKLCQLAVFFGCLEDVFSDLRFISEVFAHV